MIEQKQEENCPIFQKQSMSPLRASPFDAPLNLPSYPALSARLPFAQAESGRQWNSINQSQPNPVREVMGHPVCIVLSTWGMTKIGELC